MTKKGFFEKDVLVTKFNLIKTCYLDWIQHSTSHGLPNIHDRSNHWIIIGLWIACFLASCGVCFWLIVTSFLNYFQYEVDTKIEIFKQEQDFTFPQIAICNLNTFASPSGAEYILKEAQLQYGYNVTSISDVLGELSISSGDYSLFLANLFSSTLASSVNSTLRKSFGYSFDEMMISCTFGSNPCSSSSAWKWYYDSLNGNCFKWNTGSDSATGQTTDIKTQAVANSGLSLVLYVGAPQTDPSKMMWTRSPESGVYLSILNQTWYPLTNEGFNVKAGVCTDIRLTKTFVKEIPDPYSECQDIDSYDSIIIKELKALNITYRQTNCLDLCDQSYIIDTCGCYDFTRANIYNVEPCVNTTMQKCLLNKAFPYLRQNTHALGCSELCPIECESLSYSFSQSEAVYPSRNYASLLMENIKIVQNFENDNVSLTYETLRESLVCLNIYFSSLEYTVISSMPSVSSIDLASWTGGLLGLFLGVSLLSFIEIVELAIKVAAIASGKFQVDVSKRIESIK